MRKLDFCLRGNKGADQLCSNCTADPHLCFPYTDSTIIMPLLLYCHCAEADLYWTWSETAKTGFLASLLN